MRQEDKQTEESAYKETARMIIISSVQKIEDQKTLEAILSFVRLVQAPSPHRE